MGYIDLKYKPNHLHIWELPIDRTIIKLEVDFESFLIKEIEVNFKGKINAIKFILKKAIERNIRIDRTVFYNYSKHHFYPAWIILDLCEKLNISKKELEKHVIGYRSWKGNVWIEPAKLPIEINAVFDSIVSHLYCDGNESHNNSGGRYTQENQLAQNRFKEKLERVFGKINSSSQTLIKSYIPEIIIKIIKNYYNIDEFSSYGRLPERLKNKPKLNRIAILVAALIDEGEINDNVSICLGNKMLLEDFHNICLSLDYNISNIKKKDRGFRFYIYSRKKLLDDVKNLSLHYPICDLAHKSDDLEFRVSVENRKSQRWHKTEEDIMRILEIRNIATSKELSRGLSMTRGSVNRTLQNLKIQDKVIAAHASGKKGGYNFWMKNK